ncbi:hypothetical protein M405DRAFT_844294 [Rhizopogon salebrosus TDB-379]|nr:hypothetical protein M405DRAFT_844294 [Rhizopogon salebrosus TDB-379]
MKRKEHTRKCHGGPINGSFDNRQHKGYPAQGSWEPQRRQALQYATRIILEGITPLRIIKSEWIHGRVQASSAHTFPVYTHRPSVKSQITVQAENEQPPIQVRLHFTDQTHTINLIVRHGSASVAIPSLSSLRLDVAERCVDSIDDVHASSDQDSTRSTLQAFLAFVDQDRHHGRVYNAYKEIVRTCIRGMLANCRSVAPMADEDIRDSNTDLQEIMAFKHSQSQLSDPAYEPRFQGSANALTEGSGPFRQHPPDLSFSHTSESSSASYELDTQPFEISVLEMGTYSEAQTLPGSSAGRHQQLLLPVVQAGQEKLRCTWPGCLSVIKKDSHARHMNECHLGKVVGVCTGCGREFSRMYMKKDHGHAGGGPEHHDDLRECLVMWLAWKRFIGGTDYLSSSTRNSEYVMVLRESFAFILIVRASPESTVDQLHIIG